MLLYSLIYALSVTLIYYNFGSSAARTARLALVMERGGWIELLYVMVAMFGLYFIVFSNDLIENSVSYVIFFLVQIVIFMFLLSIKHRSFNIRQLTFSFCVVLLGIISDVIVRAFSRMFTVEIGFFIYPFCIPVFCFVVSYGLKRIMIFGKGLWSKKNNSFMYLCIFYITFGIFTFISYFIILQLFSIRSRPLFVVSFIVFLFYITSSVITLIIYSRYIETKYEGIRKKEELSSLMRYAAEIESSYDKLRKIRHDYKNILLSIPDAPLYNKFQRLFEENFEVMDKQDHIGSLRNIENLPVKSILSSKMIHFINDKMEISVDVIGRIK